MPPVVGNIIVMLIVAVALFFAIRSLWKAKKNGGACGCGGNCSACGKCCHASSGDSKPGDKGASCSCCSADSDRKKAGSKK